MTEELKEIEENETEEKESLSEEEIPDNELEDNNGTYESDAIAKSEGGKGTQRIEEKLFDESDRIAENVRHSFNTPHIRLMGKILVFGLLVCSAFIFFAGIMKYSLLDAQKKEVLQEIEKNNMQIEQLEYLIGSPVDYDYIVRIAKEKLNLYFPDEIIYYNDYRK